MASGVIYAKIAKKDANGNDNILSLQELTDLRIKFSDAGIANYEILNITEYPNYYLYSINVDNVTSSLDNNVLNHKLVASSTINLIPAGIFTRLTSSWSTTSDPLNYFNNGIYTFGDTPNIPIIYTASIGLTVVNTTGFIWGIYDIQNSSYLTASNTISLSPGSYTLTLSGSTNEIIESNAYEIGCFSNSQLFVTSLNWTITQSINPNSSSNITVLEPYLSNNFNYSDSNVLLNNAEIIPLNNFYRKVIYDNGAAIPSNYEEILSQSAEFADVKDYYYSLVRQINPRYLGSRSTSNDFNLPTTEGGFGFTPNVEKNLTYFAATNNVVSSEPEILNASIATLKFLIDSQGNTFELNNDPSQISYYNSTFTFEQNKPASLSTVEGDIYDSTILKSGYDIYPILYSDLGINYATTLSFGNGNVGDYLLNSNVQGLFGQNGQPYAQNLAIINGTFRPNRDDNTGNGFPYRFYNINNPPDSGLVTILPGSVPSTYGLNTPTYDPTQGGDGSLGPLKTGSFYQITSQIPNTKLNFRLNKMQISFGYPSGTTATAGTNWQLEISIVKTTISNITLTGDTYEWDIQDPTKTTTLTKHIYTGTVYTTVNNASPTNGTSTQVSVTDSYNPSTLTFQRDFVGNGRDVYGTTEVLETGFLSNLQVNDVIGIYVKAAKIPQYAALSISAKSDQYTYTSFNVISDPSPDVLIVTSGSFPFFSTASGNPYRLIATSKSLNTGDPTLTTGLGYVLDETPIRQNYITGSGYKPFRFLGSSINVKDEIRFEHNEAYAHRVTAFGTISGSNGEFYIDLDTPIINGVNLDWFLIRRYVPNASKMILDNNNFFYTGGFMYPEYMSQELINSIPKTIEDLKTQNLI